MIWDGASATLVLRDYLKVEDIRLKSTKPSSHSLHYSNKGVLFGMVTSMHPIFAFFRARIRKMHSSTEQTTKLTEFPDFLFRMPKSSRADHSVIAALNQWMLQTDHEADCCIAWLISVCAHWGWKGGWLRRRVKQGGAGRLDGVGDRDGG